MNSYLYAFPLLLTAFIPSAGAGTDARAIVEKAIEAQGGKAKMGQAIASYIKIKGMFHSDRWRFQGESWADGSKRDKVILRGEGNDFRTQTMVVEDTRGWFSVNGQLIDFDQRTQRRMKTSGYADKVSNLVTLVRDDGYTLTLVGDAQVKTAAAVGIKVEKPGMPVITLYFSKISGLLVKSTYILNEIDSDKDFRREVYYSNYETYDPAASPLRALKSAKQASDDAALLAFLRERVPTQEERQTIDLRIADMGQASFAVREKASAALQKLGVKAAGQLQAALQSKDAEVVRRAGQLLDRLEKTPEPALAVAVLRLIAARKPAGAVDVLLDYVPFAADENVAREGLGALASLSERDPQAKAALESALVHVDSAVRQAASAALGKDGGKFLKQPWRRLVIDGLRMARTVHIDKNGQRDFEMEVVETEFYNRFDDAMYARPSDS
jgi:hypothetical protein